MAYLNSGNSPEGGVNCYGIRPSRRDSKWPFSTPIFRFFPAHICRRLRNS